MKNAIIRSIVNTSGDVTSSGSFYYRDGNPGEYSRNGTLDGLLLDVENMRECGYDFQHVMERKV